MSGPDALSHLEKGASPAKAASLVSDEQEEDLVKSQQQRTAHHPASLEEDCVLNRVTLMDKLRHYAGRANVEKVGIEPLTVDQRTGTKAWSVGLLWASANINVLTFGTGALAPILGLGMVPALVSIAGFSILMSIIPAYFSIWGPKTGLRQMVFTRYTWGYYPTGIIIVLASVGEIGFSILNTILAGQTLSSASPDGLNVSVGIVIAAVISLAIAFSGIKILHIIERYAWTPVLISFVILTAMAGTGPDGLHIPADSPPVAARPVLSMGALIAGYIMSWDGMSCDMTHYLRPDTNSLALFAYAWSGFFFGTAPVMMLGAAFACAAVDIPAWTEALETSSGALFVLVIGRNGGSLAAFARFISVIFSLSVQGNIAATFYANALALMTLPIPQLHRVPRAIMPLITTAITVPLAIVGADRFNETLTNFLAVLGYWSAMYTATVLVEHLWFRKNDCSNYDPRIYKDARKLPTGLAALFASILSVAFVVPSVDQVWFAGPIATRVGDLGFELGLIASAVFYLPLRWLELRLTHGSRPCIVSDDRAQ